jgi:2',3'-cyclic-nucleotide 2'-phosphodiesterase (5'-nucleotidase family)
MNSTFTILHTNDFHNKLQPEQCKRLQDERGKVEQNGLLLDAGDAISSGNITFKPGGEPILTSMSDIGYDGMTVGNREFHFSRTGFNCKLSCARFPVFSANVRLKADPIPAWRSLIEAGKTIAGDVDLPVHGYRQFTLAGGYRIAVFGVTVPMITERMRVARVSAYLFEDPQETALSISQAIREILAPDLIVCLSHIGERQDRALAAKAEAIDVIIGGHSHTLFEQGTVVNNVLVVQTGSHARYLGVLNVDPDKKGIDRFTEQVKPL